MVPAYMQKSVILYSYEAKSGSGVGLMSKEFVCESFSKFGRKPEKFYFAISGVNLGAFLTAGIDASDEKYPG